MQKNGNGYMKFPMKISLSNKKEKNRLKFSRFSFM